MANDLSQKLQKGMQKQLRDSKLAELGLNPDTVRRLLNEQRKLKAAINSLETKLIAQDALNQSLQMSLQICQKNLRQLKTNWILLVPALVLLLAILLLATH